MFRLLFLAIGMIPLTTLDTQAQTYYNAGGIRVSDGDLGISYKQRTSAKGAVEGIVTYDDFGDFDVFGVSLLYQIHENIRGTDFIRWYYGVGGNITFFEDNTVISAIGDLGLDFIFKDIPLNLCVDVFPALRLTDGTDLDFSGSLGIRYIFSR